MSERLWAIEYEVLTAKGWACSVAHYEYEITARQMVDLLEKAPSYRVLRLVPPRSKDAGVAAEEQVSR